MDAEAEDNGAKQDHKEPKDEVGVLKGDGARLARDENARGVKHQGQKDHRRYDAHTCRTT